MRYEIIYSHRGFRKNRIEALADFFVQARQLDENKAIEQVEFIDEFRLQHSSLCFEAIAMDGSKVVGYMRCFNNPVNKTGWFVGDIYVLKDYRRRKIAYKLYQKLIDEVMTYEEAEYIEASISLENQTSVNLHEKLGFVNTKRSKSFADFYFGKKERIFKLKLLKALPLVEDANATDFLEPIWDKLQSSEAAENFPALSRMSLSELLHKALAEDVFSVYIVWCGNRPVGIQIYGDEACMEYICS